MKAHIKITLKSGVIDPQGKAIGHSLEALGFEGVKDVRQGKYIELELDETNPDEARARTARMCEQLLANMVIEDYEIMLDQE